MATLSESVGKYIFIAVIILIFVMAIYWEMGDFKIIKGRKDLNDIHDKDEKAKELLFYGCYNAETNIRWREIFIMSILSAILIFYVLKQSDPNAKVSVNLFILVFMSIFIMFIISSMYKTYHLYNGMCSKINPEKVPLHEF